MWSEAPAVGERLQRRLRAEPPAIRDLRRELGEYAKAVGASPATVDAVKLASSEALTNVIVHAYVGGEPGPMIVEAWTDEDGHLLVRVGDEGVGMVPRPDSPGLGLGLSIMAQMADELRVANRHDGMGAVVSMRFSLDGSASTLASDDGVG
jgi:serine/threonine-protein kinase RsbW/stage II sporulation protein AB (anti-sigma F factor)